MQAVHRRMESAGTQWDERMREVLVRFSGLEATLVARISGLEDALTPLEDRDRVVNLPNHREEQQQQQQEGGEDPEHSDQHELEQQKKQATTTKPFSFAMSIRSILEKEMERVRAGHTALRGGLVDYANKTAEQSTAQFDELARALFAEMAALREEVSIRIRRAEGEEYGENGGWLVL